MAFKVKDHYFKKAKKENFLARSIYKLEEIDHRYKLISPGANVLDLGYHPGSWLQYVQKVIGPQGRAIGVDIKPVNPKLLLHKNISLFQYDFLAVDFLNLVGGQLFDVVLSDMAPNTTGIRDVDQSRSFELVESLMNRLPSMLRPGGNFVVKVFEGEEFQKALIDWRKKFSETHLLRPKSTRSSSKEIFFIGKGMLYAKKEI